MSTLHEAAAASPGGTLKELARALEAEGQQVGWNAEATELWRHYGRGVFMRLPTCRFDPVSPDTIRQLLQVRGTRVVDYWQEPTAATPANSILYLCRDPEYDLMRLSKNGRKAIRRGLSHVQICRISWDEFAEHGYAALAETDCRHGYAKPDKASFQALVERCRRSPFHEVWGAWQGDDLISWLLLEKVNDWADFLISPSRAPALHNYANNALRYEILHHLMTVEKRRAVVTGISAIKSNIDPRTAHAYNTRMGFEAVPVRRVMIPCWWLRALAAHRPAAWFWATLNRLLPRSATLDKAAGLSKFLCGIDKRPLAWAETPQDEGEAPAKSDEYSSL